METMETMEARFKFEGSEYRKTRDLSITDISKLIKKELKQEYPKCKFSIQTQYYSGGAAIHIYLMEADFNPFNDLDNIRSDPRTFIDREQGLREVIEKGYTQCNKMYSSVWNKEQDYESEQGYNVMKKVESITAKYNMDDSDCQVDYFHVHFYTHLNIGKYDKPFKQI